MRIERLQSAKAALSHFERDGAESRSTGPFSQKLQHKVTALCYNLHADAIESCSFAVSFVSVRCIT